jgi:heat shock protein HtpX
MGNQIKTVLLLGALTGLILFIGGYLGGESGMTIALIFAIVMNFSSYWFSDKIVLAMYGAKEVKESDYPYLYSVVRRLSQRGGLPLPRIYIIPTESPNAFATGRNPNHAVVAVTEGIMRILDETELEGVIAHELSHIKNRDILISTIAATMAGAIMWIANMARFAAIFGGIGGRDDDDSGGILGLLVLTIITPIAAMIIQLAISRSREYLADQSGAKIAGTPLGLAKALEKLHYVSSRAPLQVNPATSHLFIVNPLSGKNLMNLFSTHPPIEKRIQRLIELRV